MNVLSHAVALDHDTPLTFEYPDSGNSAETTWGEFATVNADDPDMLADVAEQIAEHNYAEIGGGAAPLVWVFA